MVIKKEKKSYKSGVNTKVLQQHITQKVGGGKSAKVAREVAREAARKAVMDAAEAKAVAEAKAATKAKAKKERLEVTKAADEEKRRKEEEDVAEKAKAKAAAKAATKAAGKAAADAKTKLGIIYTNSMIFIDSINTNTPAPVAPIATNTFVPVDTNTPTPVAPVTPVAPNTPSLVATNTPSPVAPVAPVNANYYNGFIINMSENDYNSNVEDFKANMDSLPEGIDFRDIINIFSTNINTKINIIDIKNASVLPYRKSVKSNGYFNILRELFKYELKYRISTNPVKETLLPKNIIKGLPEGNLKSVLQQHILGQEATSWLRIISIFLNELVNTTYKDDYIFFAKGTIENNTYCIYFELHFILKNILRDICLNNTFKQIFQGVKKHLYNNLLKIKNYNPDNKTYLKSYSRIIGLHENNVIGQLKSKDNDYLHDFIYILKDVIYIVSSFVKILDLFKGINPILQVLKKKAHPTQIVLIDTLNIIAELKKLFITQFSKEYIDNGILLLDDKISQTKQIEWALTNHIPYTVFIEYIKTNIIDTYYPKDIEMTPIFFTKHQSINNSEAELKLIKDNNIIEPGGAQKIEEIYYNIWSDSQKNESNELDDYALVFVFMFYVLTRFPDLNLEALNLEALINIKILSNDTHFLGIPSSQEEYKKYYIPTTDVVVNNVLYQRILEILNIDENIRTIKQNDQVPPAPRTLWSSGKEQPAGQAPGYAAFSSNRGRGQEPGYAAFSSNRGRGQEPGYAAFSSNRGRGQKPGYAAFSSNRGRGEGSNTPWWRGASNYSKGGTRKKLKYSKKFINKHSQKYKSYNTNKNKNKNKYSKKTF